MNGPAQHGINTGCKYYLHCVGFLNVRFEEVLQFSMQWMCVIQPKRDILQSPSLSWISWFAFYEKFYNSPWTCTSSNCMPYTRIEGLFIQGGLLGFKTKFLWSLPTMLRWEHSVKEAKLCNHTAQHMCTILRSETLTNKRTLRVLWHSPTVWA